MVPAPGMRRSRPGERLLGRWLGMDYTRLGRSGLTVSRIGLGCMSYGRAASGMHQWTLDEEAAKPFLQQAVEFGRHLLGHRQRLPRRHLGGVRRPGHRTVLPTRG